MIEILGFEFMRNAVIAGVLASLACGVIGTLVVVNRIVFISGGISHAAYGGIGIAFFFGLPYIVGTLGFSLIAAGIMAMVMLKYKHRSDTVIGVLWAVGMATGIILLDLSPGYSVDLMSYLFGSILTVPSSDLKWMTLLSAVVIFSVFYFYNDFLAMSYDEDFARIRGVPVTFLYFLLLGMVAVTVVLIIRIVGLILVIALMTIPPFIAEKYTKTLWRMMLFSTGLNCLFTLLGLWLSYLWNLTSGATIIMVAAAGFFVSLAADQIKIALTPQH